MAGQTRCCMQRKRVRERNVIAERKKRRERRHHHQPTPERRPTVKRQIIVRLIVMHFFLVLSILVVSCPFYSLSRALACLPLTSSSPVRRSVSLSLSLFPHTCIHTHTISVQGHNKIREWRTRERSRKNVVINGHFTHQYKYPFCANDNDYSYVIRM